MTETARRLPIACGAGRPTRDQASALAERIVLAAADLFAKNGYQATSVEAIARAAGVAKRTVYSRFEGKPQVLAAVLRLLVGRLTPPPPRGLSQPGLRARLEALGHHVLGYCVTDEAIVWNRLVASELARVPELAEVTRQEAKDVLEDYVAGLLREAVEASELPDTDTTFAAIAFLRLITAPAYAMAHLGAPAPTVPEQQRHVVQSVAFFLRGCGGHPA